ncbi:MULTISPECIES: NUDIX domain-containing protein [unclassified Aeromicrobium]|jgi:8-oxo-dGTP diphosphatase|uniref:NUDIX hydrolase n=1 Tax=unclassified Aeromicrobium TaxID=2633570 RepID=UPI0020983B76|nr:MULTISPECIES: NUDIX domain-containing protein [unclassified Aeromicrobium]MCO7239531.1 NUDIX domain-containing protein [Aeromicrobium sp. CnD17-E]MDR6119933.1 8-oxo-dGTP diphosphatase [Aeromicrobium sp. SORGH_AS_0981]
MRTDVETDTGQVSLAVSTVIFALRPHPTTGRTTLWLPLVRRIREPYEGRWALPGGPLRPDEDLAASARHTLERTTGLAPRHLEQLYSFGAVDRSPEDRVVSIVYWALVRPDEDARATDGENVEWFVADDVRGLAFDHDAILHYALARLRAKITYSPIAFAFVTPEFTLADLRAVHEAVLDRSLDPANFRRQVLASGTVTPTGSYLTGTSHRPPALYRRAALPEEIR